MTPVEGAVDGEHEVSGVPVHESRDLDPMHQLRRCRCMRTRLPSRPDVAVEPQAVAIVDDDGCTQASSQSVRGDPADLRVVVTVVSLVAVVLYVNGSISIEEAGPLFAVIGALSMVFWFWMLFDAASNGALMWALAIVFFGTVGALVYLFLGRKRANDWHTGF